MKADLLAKIAAMKAAKELESKTVAQPVEVKVEETTTVAAVAAPEVKNNIEETPALLRQLLGIVETIEESSDDSETALIKASEQVEKCKAYIVYLESILPILKAKTEAMIEEKYRGANPLQKRYSLN